MCSQIKILPSFEKKLSDQDDRINQTAFEPGVIFIDDDGLNYFGFSKNCPEWGLTVKMMIYVHRRNYWVLALFILWGCAHTQPREKGKQMNTRAEHVLTIIAVSDLKRSVDLYTQAFGWPINENAPNYVELKSADGHRFGLYQKDSFFKKLHHKAIPHLAPQEITGTEIYIHCAELEKCFSRLLKAGATPMAEITPMPWGDDVGYAADPDGNVIAVARPTRKN